MKSGEMKVLDPGNWRLKQREWVFETGIMDGINPKNEYLKTGNERLLTHQCLHSLGKNTDVFPYCLLC